MIVQILFIYFYLINVKLCISTMLSYDNVIYKKLGTYPQQLLSILFYVQMRGSIKSTAS